MEANPQQASILFKAMVAAVYSTNTLMTLLMTYCQANDDGSDLYKNIRLVVSEAQLSTKRLAQLVEQITNGTNTASKSIVIGAFPVNSTIQQIVDQLRNPNGPTSTDS